VFNLVQRYGAEVDGPIISHRDVNLISFTGGTKTGETVNSMEALQFKKVSLELGGKNSMIVFDDCDLE
jgi:acyl-CoA reductase-like NAD-dependent aldehyde dehydrogenase